MLNRSYLFVPGDQPRLIAKAFQLAADAVILDLEDGVAPEGKETARTVVGDAIREHAAWVRVQPPGTDECARDLDAVGEQAFGIRVPKVESPEQVAWVSGRAPGKPLICSIESARGLLAAAEIAAAPAVANLGLGGMDLALDLGIADGDLELLYARSHLVTASRAAGIDPPIDRVYPHLANEEGLAAEATHARRLGFFGKSAIHPKQLGALHGAFSPDERALAWARSVIEAFEASDGAPTTLTDGEFVDLPVERRARRLLELAAVSPGTR